MFDLKELPIKPIESVIRCKDESAQNENTVKDWTKGKAIPAINTYQGAKRSTPVFGKRKAS